MATATRTNDAPAELPEREHRAGCPATRTERYPERVPAKGDRPAKDVIVIRCLDCGGHLIQPA